MKIISFDPQIFTNYNLSNTKEKYFSMILVNIFLIKIATLARLYLPGIGQTNTPLYAYEMQCDFTSKKTKRK